MEVQGKIRVILPAESGVSQRTGNTWMSQDFVLDYFWWPNQSQPSQMVLRVFGEDRIKNFDLHVNDEVKLTFHVEAHEYDGRWFNGIQCTQCQKIGSSAQTNTNQPANADNAQQADNNTSPSPSAPQEGGEADDLPF